MKQLNLDIKSELLTFEWTFHEAFELEDTFGCGQAFRWEPVEIGSNQPGYLGIVDGEAIIVWQEGQSLKGISIGTCEEKGPHDQAFWSHYFDADRSYKIIIESLRGGSPELSEALDFGRGIRLLNQDFFEMLMTFIISANNNIPRITGSIDQLSRRFGCPIENTLGLDLYRFPKAEAIARADVSELKACGVGYRDLYLHKAANRWLQVGAVDFVDQLNQMDYKEAKLALTAFEGVGPKVADCILLFATAQHNAFPVDTWIQKALGRYYDVQTMKPKALDAFLEDKFGVLKGFAQQYIFHFERNSGVRASVLGK